MPDDIFMEINFSSLQEYADKIRLNSFYADEPELISISRIKNIWIAIFDELRKTWKNIKCNNNIKPSNIVFISFKDTRSDLSSNYNAIKFYDNFNDKKKLTPTIK